MESHTAPHGSPLPLLSLFSNRTICSSWLRAICSASHPASPAACGLSHAAPCPHISHLESPTVHLIENSTLHPFHSRQHSWQDNGFSDLTNPFSFQRLLEMCLSSSWTLAGECPSITVCMGGTHWLPSWHFNVVYSEPWKSGLKAIWKENCFLL